MKPVLTLAAWTLFACWGLPAFAAPAPGAPGSGELVVAASRGDEDKVVALLKAGSDINARDASGYTPLIWATIQGHDGVVLELIRRGADLDAQDKEGYSAMMWAAQRRRSAIVAMLTTRGADPNLRDKGGYTALVWAAQDGQTAIADNLLKGGASLNVRDNEAYTPLMWAAQQGHTETVRLLLSRGADPRQRDRRGYTALDLAAAANQTGPRRVLADAEIRMAAAESRARRMQRIPVAHAAPRPTAVKVRAPRVWSASQPRLVAVVQTRPDEYTQVSQAAHAAPMQVETRPAVLREGVLLTALQQRLLGFDVDANKIVDGRDWRRLATTRKVALATLLHDARCNKRYCNPNHLDSVIDKLDWVYGSAEREVLTLNMAYDFPTATSQPVSW